MRKHRSCNRQQKKHRHAFPEWLMENKPVEYLSAVTPLAKIAAGLIALALILWVFYLTRSTTIGLTLTSAIVYAIRWIFHKSS